MGDDAQTRLREALKLVAVTLKEGEAPFALAGGYALWARGGPEPDHDVDFVIAEEDARRVYEVLPHRLARFELEVSPEKTRLVYFGRPGGGRPDGEHEQDDEHQCASLPRHHPPPSVETSIAGRRGFD